MEDEDLTLENLNMKMNLIMMRKIETRIINGKSQTDIGEPIYICKDVINIHFAI